MGPNATGGSRRRQPHGGGRRWRAAAPLNAATVIDVLSQAILGAAGAHHCILRARDFRFQGMWAEGERQGLQLFGRGQPLIQAGLGGVVARRCQELFASRHHAAFKAIQRSEGF